MTIADRIIVMDAGKILAIGSNSELVATSPLYAELAATQFLASAGWTSNRRCQLDSVVEYGIDDRVMRTSELAGRAGVNIQTLRYYERRGILDGPPRTAGGYRDYPSTALDLLRFTKRAQGLGFTLAEVQELLHLSHGGPDGCDAARTLAEAREADLRARIADLQRMRDSLTDLIATCDLPRADRTCTMLRAIENKPTRPADRDPR